MRRTEAERNALAANRFTYPFDVVPNFEENEAVRGVVMSFCQK